MFTQSMEAFPTYILHYTKTIVKQIHLAKKIRSQSPSFEKR